MADGVAITAGSGTTILTDDTGAGGHAQVVKLAVSTDGSGTLLPADSTNGLYANVKALPYGVLDTFGKVQVVSSINDIDVQFYRDTTASNAVVSTVSGGGAITQTTGLAQLTTSTGTTGSSKAVSRDAVLYRSGGEVFAIFTAAWLDGGQATSLQRIGLYDASNGMFIGYENTTFGVTVRQNAVDTQTAAASFNVDLLTGAAGSRFTRAGTPEAADFTKLNLFRIRFGWLGAAPIRFEIASPDGEWVLFHVIRQPNLSATPHIYNADLPITAEVTKTGGATNIRLNTACWGGGLTYDKLDIVGSGTLGTAANSVVNYNPQGIGTLNLRVGTGTTGTMIIEATNDGVNWITHPECWKITAGAASSVVTAAFTPASGDNYRVQCVGYRGVRARTATTLGAAVSIHHQGDENVSIVTISPTAAATTNSTSSDGGTALTSTAQAIKASPGLLKGYYIFNPNTSTCFVNFYNTASGSVTVGTTAPLFHLPIPALSAANLWTGDGVAFSTAMSWSATATAGSNTAPTTALEAVAWYA